jgi:hypothetical protein
MGGQNANRLEVRVRGNAHQLLEKYKVMARDAHQAGDRVAAEYYLQHADHYFRVLNDSRIRGEEMRARRGVFDPLDEEGPDEEGEMGALEPEQMRERPRRDDRSRREDGERPRREAEDRYRRDPDDRQERPPRRDFDERPRRDPAIRSDRTRRDPDEADRQGRDSDGDWHRGDRADAPSVTGHAFDGVRMTEAGPLPADVSDGEAALAAFGGVVRDEAVAAPRRRGRPRKAAAVEPELAPEGAGDA